MELPWMIKFYNDLSNLKDMAIFILTTYPLTSTWLYVKNLTSYYELFCQRFWSMFHFLMKNVCSYSATETLFSFWVYFLLSYIKCFRRTRKYSERIYIERAALQIKGISHPFTIRCVAYSLTNPLHYKMLKFFYSILWIALYIK